MRNPLHWAVILATVVVSGCAQSKPDAASEPRRETAARPVEARVGAAPPPATESFGDPAEEEMAVVPSVEPPASEGPPVESVPDQPKAEPVEETQPEFAPAAPQSSATEGPVGGGGPPATASLSQAPPVLPPTYRINPLRPKFSSRAPAEPRILESPRRSFLRDPSEAAAAPAAAAPSAPELPGAAAPADVPDAFATPPATATPPADETPNAITPPVPPRATGSASLPGTGAGDASSDARIASAPPAAPAQRDRNVKVFFGTNRRAAGDPREYFEWSLGWWPGAVAGLLAVALGIAAALQPQRRLVLTIATCTVGTMSGMFILRGPLAHDVPPASSEAGLDFTAERGRMSLGWCEVSIPPDHDPGEVESPSILRLEVRPDPKKHVVLKHVERLERDSFFTELREKVQQSPRQDLFLFVHGYNVSFEDAARRTAQISFDLKFEGAAVFFSWPSQAELLKYTVDENNVAWSSSHLKEFLLDVVRHTDAKSVNLIAHSMGNRALGQAIREIEFELRQGNAIFDEVVLAAPDIDAGIFKRDIAPALRRTARHATLYASTHDQALLASKFVHGYPRAGDSGAGIVVVEGVDTIDVSRIDLSLLGHSYYGSSEPILEDLDELISESRRPDQRTWLKPAERDGLRYWTFRDDLRNRRSRVSMRPKNH